MRQSMQWSVALAALAAAAAALWWSVNAARAEQQTRRQDTPSRDVEQPAARGAVDRQPARFGRGERPSAAMIERGEYLVHHVAKCVECHTPRTDAGDLIQRRMLMGARIPVRSPYETWDWADASVRLAGLGAYSRRDVIRVLTEHVGPDGKPPRPPMPDFHMKQEDAEAIVAYLATVTPPP